MLFTLVSLYQVSFKGNINFFLLQTSHTLPTSRITASSAKGNTCVHFTATPHCQFMGFNMQASFGGAGTLTIGTSARLSTTCHAFVAGDEEYIFELPTAYARSIVSTPWFELGKSEEIYT